jgi:porin
MKAAAAAGAIAAAPASAEPFERGLRLGAIYTSDSVVNLEGGLKTGFSQMGMLELTADAQWDVFGVDGLTAHANFEYVHGRSLSGRLIGDAQVSSNIDAPNGIRLFEAWVSVPVARDGFVKAGLIDLNSEFDVQDVGAVFLNSSHGIGPDFSQSGRNGPSIFPTTSSAVVAGVTRGKLSFRAGLFDAVSGDPDHPRRTVVRFPGDTGLLLVGETEFQLADGAKLQIGAWTYTTRFETISDPEKLQRENRGAYALVEGRLGSIIGQPIEAWVRVGTANTRFNAIGRYAGGGVTIGSPERRFGAAIAHARLGSPARMNSSERAETIVEVTYAHTIGDRLTIQPDVQYVVNPGFYRSLRNSLSAGVRLQLQVF